MSDVASLLRTNECAVFLLSLHGNSLPNKLPVKLVSILVEKFPSARNITQPDIHRDRTPEGQSISYTPHRVQVYIVLGMEILLRQTMGACAKGKAPLFLKTRKLYGQETFCMFPLVD